MRTLGFTLLTVGFLWACASVFLFRASVIATTSVSLEVLEGRENFTRDEVFTIITHQGQETRRGAPWIFTPALLMFCGGILLSRHKHTLPAANSNSVS
jgi:hypothetical protein